jgi:hypothetical protein
MQKVRSRLIAIGVAAALAVPLIGIEPAQAAPAPNGCKNSSVPGAEIGHFPAQPASQSSLRISCTFNNNPGTSQVSGKFRIQDFPHAQYHNGAARTVFATALIPSGATSFTAANVGGGPALCQGMTAYVNRGITAVGAIGIPARTFVTSITAGCVVNLSNATTANIATTVPLKIDNVNGPRSRADVTFTNGSTTITSPTANFLASDVGLSVSATEALPGTNLAAPCGGVTCTLTIAATATSPVGGSEASFGGATRSTSSRQINDATITAVNQITSVASKWTAADIGLDVTGTNIPANTYILSFAGNVATTTGGMTVSAVPQNVVVGDPSATAPNGTDTVGMQGVQLDLSPTLVAGSEDCALENAEGFATVARWNNPGSFSGAALFNTQPPNTKAIGQILFDTSVVDFSMFVVEINTPLGPGSFKYELVAPNLPTGTAMCPGTATSPGLGFSLGIQAQTLAVGSLPAGTGRPGTAQVRSLIPVAYAGGLQQGYASNATVVSDDPLITFSPASEFTRLCVYPAGAAQVNFKCGNG